MYSGRINTMHKNAIRICGFTIGAGAFGMFFRWLQDQIVFEADTGLVKPGVLNIVVPAVIIFAAFLFYKLYNGMKTGGYVPSEEYYTAFREDSKILIAAAWVFGILMALGGIALRFATRFEGMSGVYFAMMLLAVFSGFGFPLAYTAPKTRYSPGLVCVLMTFPIVLFTLWLIVSYRVHADIPTVWSFAIEILCLSAALVAFFLVAGYPYGKTRPGLTLFMLMSGAFMCIMSLADERSFAQQLIIISAAGMFMLYLWTFVDNMSIPTDGEENADEQPEQDDDAQVIEAGTPDTEPPEPTLRFPEK